MTNSNKNICMKKSDELQSRREFFKKAAKGVLPILGLVMLPTGVQAMLRQVQESHPSTACKYDCSYLCRENCQTTCRGNCFTNCGHSCDGVCYDDCMLTCKGGCESSCRGTCRATCVGYGTAALF